MKVVQATVNNKDREARRKAAEALADYVAGNYIPEDLSPNPATIHLSKVKRLVFWGLVFWKNSLKLLEQFFAK